MPLATSAALGFRVHSGWAAAVAMGGSLRAPVVLERCRIEMADARLAGSRQPYHAAERLDIQKTETLIRRCRDSSTRLATSAVSAMAGRIANQGHGVVGASVLFASGRALPDLAKTLQSHALIHTAEGEFFREALVRACEQCSLIVTRIKEREAWERGAGLLGLNAARLQQHIGELGRPLGPPWRQDEKLASLAAWIVLAAAV